MKFLSTLGIMMKKTFFCLPIVRQRGGFLAGGWQIQQNCREGWNAIEQVHNILKSLSFA